MKKEEEEEKEYTEEAEETKEKQDEWETHAFSLLDEEEEDERKEERVEDGKDKDMLSLSKMPCFQQKSLPGFCGRSWQHVCCHDFSSSGV